MGPKKGAAKADGEPEDVSCEQLYKNYRKNCQQLGCEVNKQIKKMYDEGWVENAEPIKKVGKLIGLTTTVSYMGRDRLAGCSCFDRSRFVC